MTQVVEHLPSKCEAQSSNPSTTKKKKKYWSVLRVNVKQQKKIHWLKVSNSLGIRYDKCSFLIQSLPPCPVALQT
jgi:hypothetical protein